MEALPSLVITHKKKNGPTVEPIIEMPQLSNKQIFPESEINEWLIDRYMCLQIDFYLVLRYAFKN